ncbi:hypothetical protein [Burkholderia ubonensis]|uniref:hypothetical protein n=1 Tax=Burkholderia ubonensis TaxID=101571 RepID=UPI0007C66D7C|nr:hypothetical protein [Burkholderia ubonensis]
MNEIIEMPQRAPAALVNAGRMSAMEVVAHAAAVQEVMRAVMKENVHYGKIPGTPKPALYKAGAEVLCMSFRIADEYRIDDLSTPDMIRYRVTCVGKHQTSGIELGSGMGEASTGEEKYKWRGAVCDEEFEITPATMRRVKFGKKQGGGFYKANQVRTEPSDLANTVLKMACKRAKMAMVLNVTAASDIFSQDLEELDETLRDHLAGQEGAGEPVLSALAQKLVEEVKAVKTREEFDALWKRGVKEINAAKDAGASDAFKAAMAEKSKSLPAKQAELPQREPGADDDLEEDFKQQLAREQGGAQ